MVIALPFILFGVTLFKRLSSLVFGAFHSKHFVLPPNIGIEIPISLLQAGQLVLNVGYFDFSILSLASNAKVQIGHVTSVSMYVMHMPSPIIVLIVFRLIAFFVLSNRVHNPVHILYIHR